jgi:hypothetical protein
MDKRSKYGENVHYVYFIVDSLEKYQQNDNKKKYTRAMFLTYIGFVRVLFLAKENELAEKFQKWALEILFIHQFGNKEEKMELSGKLLGINPNAVKMFLNKSASKVPCVYSFIIGNVDNLRESMDIPKKYKNDSVIKFGATDDLERRTGEHEKTYGKIEGSKFSLGYFSYIDAKFIFDAETMLKDFLKPYLFQYGKHVEIIIVDKKIYNTKVKQHFVNIFSLYGGMVKQLVAQINDEIHKRELSDANHKVEMSDERHKNELLQKQMELLEQKMKAEIASERHKNELLINENKRLCKKCSKNKL